MIDWDLVHDRDDRLARAVVLILTRPDLSEVDAVGWLDRIETDNAAKPRGTTAAYLPRAVRAR